MAKQGVIITRRESDIPCNYPIMRYRVVIGITGHEEFGFCVGEARARLMNDRYLLEMTWDPKENERDMTKREMSEDKRRFSLIGKGIVGDKWEASEICYRYAKLYAERIRDMAGLEIIDLTKKVEESGKDQEPISIHDMI